MDSCSIWIDVAECDAPTVREVMEVEEDSLEINDGFVRLRFDETNYAADDRISDLAIHKIPFVVSNEEGLNYGRSLRICDGKTPETEEHDCDRHDLPVVSIGEDGTFSNEQIEYAKYFWQKTQNIYFAMKQRK